ncbi:MAG: hypothetical protein U0X86_001086 [Wolbachia endosymbiont of Xenopsylla cheopis]
MERLWLYIKQNILRNSESSSKNDDFKFLRLKCRKCLDQPDINTLSLIRKRRRLSDISNTSSSQSELSKYKFETSSNGSSVNSHRSSLPESLVYRLKRCFNELDSPKSNLSEPCTSQNVKKVRFE